MLDKIFGFLSVFLLSSFCLASNSNAKINWWKIGSEYADTPAFGWYIITFIIFVALVISAIKKPLLLYLQTRSNDIRQQIEEAKLAKKEANERLAQYEQRLLNLDNEIAKMQADFKRQGEKEKEDIKKLAKKIASQITKDAGNSILAEFNHAKDELKSQTAKIVIQEAQEKIKMRINEQ
ncbi:ATP synthase F0 subunit B, partial [Sulfobacillus acidophilus]|nr:ATP synthase F0 subunit B [Sulfobacillus acidophilus]